jgi:hypothetical protein
MLILISSQLDDCLNNITITQKKTIKNLYLSIGITNALIILLIVINCFFEIKNPQESKYKKVYYRFLLWMTLLGNLVTFITSSILLSMISKSNFCLNNPNVSQDDLKSIKTYVWSNLGISLIILLINIFTIMYI